MQHQMTPQWTLIHLVCSKTHSLSFRQIGKNTWFLESSGLRSSDWRQGANSWSLKKNASKCFCSHNNTEILPNKKNLTKWESQKWSWIHVITTVNFFPIFFLVKFDHIWFFSINCITQFLNWHIENTKCDSGAKHCKSVQNVLMMRSCCASLTAVWGTNKREMTKCEVAHVCCWQFVKPKEAIDSLVCDRWKWHVMKNVTCQPCICLRVILPTWASTISQLKNDAVITDTLSF